MLLTVVSLVILCFTGKFSCPDPSENDYPPDDIDPSVSTSVLDDDDDDSSRVQPYPLPPHPVDDTTTTSECICIASNQECTFVLDGYATKGTKAYLHDDIGSFGKKVASFLNLPTPTGKASRIMDIIITGTADGIPFSPGSLKWADIPAVLDCQAQQTGYLTEVDLARVRRCLVKYEILQNLDTNVLISDSKWTPQFKNIDDGLESGVEHRKVEVRIFLSSTSCR